MSPLNRRDFLLSGVAAAAALAPHLSAMTSEGAARPCKPVLQKVRPSLQPRFGREQNFVNWREQGLNFGEKSYRDRQCIR